jgi:pimeloyl-ACP methyl ester carboxylesterase
MLGYSEGACIGALFAATHPELTHSLITVGGYARWSEADDFPHGTKREEVEECLNP